MVEEVFEDENGNIQDIEEVQDSDIPTVNYATFDKEINNLYNKVTKKPINKDDLVEEMKNTAFYHARAVHLRSQIKEYVLLQSEQLNKLKTIEYITQRGLLESAGEKVSEARMDKVVNNIQSVQTMQKDIESFKGLDLRASGLVDTLMVTHSSLKHMAEHIRAEKQWGEYG